MCVYIQTTLYNSGYTLDGTSIIKKFFGVFITLVASFTIVVLSYVANVFQFQAKMCIVFVAPPFLLFCLHWLFVRVV